MANNGLKETLAAMERVKLAAKEAAMKRLIQGAEDVAAMQKQLVPVDEGDLRDSITVTIPGQSTPAYSQPGGSRVAGENEVIVTAGNVDARHAHLVQYGTSKMEARDYFWAAYYLYRNRVMRSTASAFSRAARKEWNR